MRRLLIAAAVLVALAFQSPQGTAKDQSAIGPVRDEVDQEPGDVGREDVTRAELRGRIALLRGQRQRAIAAFRKVVAFRKAELEGLWARVGQICDLRTLVDAEGELAVARVLLAEAERRPERLAKHLPEVIRYHRSRIATIENLLRLAVIDSQEGAGMLRGAQAELREARERLAEVQEQLQRRQDGKSKPASPR